MIVTKDQFNELMDRYEESVGIKELDKVRHSIKQKIIDKRNIEFDIQALSSYAESIVAALDKWPFNTVYEAMHKENPNKEVSEALRPFFNNHKVKVTETLLYNYGDGLLIHFEVNKTKYELIIPQNSAVKMGNWEQFTYKLSFNESPSVWRTIVEEFLFDRFRQEATDILFPKEKKENEKA